MQRQTFYEPTTGGYERAITERLRHWAQLRNGSTTDPTPESDAD
jgi:putative ATPase